MFENGLLPEKKSPCRDDDASGGGGGTVRRGSHPLCQVKDYRSSLLHSEEEKKPPLGNS